MEKFGILLIGSSEKTIAILLVGDRWWPQTAKQQGDNTSEPSFHVTYANHVMSAQMFGGVPIRSRNGAPTRKGCVDNDQMAETSNK